MNWTGGNLSRHRRGKGWKEEVARQKEYFAKARSRQREQDKPQPPVTLCATDFIRDYASAAKPSTSLDEAETRTSASVLCGKPVSAAAEVSASLGDRPHNLQRDATELPIATSPRKNDRPLLSDQSLRDGSIGASDPKAVFQRLLARIDSAGTAMPRLADLEPLRGRESLTISRHTSAQQQHLRTSGYRKPSEAGRKRDKRKRKLRQATPSPKSIRIRVGSQDYRWSESRNSIAMSTAGGRSQTQSRAPEKSTRRLQSTYVNSASHLIEEFLTGSSSSCSHPALSSPCRSRASRLRELHNSTSPVTGAIPTELQLPPPDCACGPGPESPSRAPPASEIDSTDSIAVQATDDGLMPEMEMDEERIWRQWLE